jgi:hypothetical protein
MPTGLEALHASPMDVGVDNLSRLYLTMKQWKNLVKNLKTTYRHMTFVTSVEQGVFVEFKKSS